jgi:hypothetical protein
MNGIVPFFLNCMYLTGGIVDNSYSQEMKEIVGITLLNNGINSM